MASESKVIGQAHVGSVHSFFNRNFPASETLKSNSESGAEMKPNATTDEKQVGLTRANTTAGSDNSVAKGDVKRVNDGSTGGDALSCNIEGGVDYKNMVWWQAGMVMIAETISLGILSLPAALSILGLIPGLLLLLLLGMLASYTGFVIGQFKLRHPSIYSMADAGEILFGPIGREILGFGQLMFYIFIMGSHILTFSIMMNAITGHATCTVVFMFAGMALSWALTIPRTLKNLSYYSVVSFVSIIGAVGITMICVSITKPRWSLDAAALATRSLLTTREAISPPTLPAPQTFSLFPAPGVSFHHAFLATANIVFAYAGHVAFFSFISELKRPQDFTKALALLQCSDITMYVVSAVVIYVYAGNNVSSPALDSASPLVRKIAYGVAVPTIVIAGVVNGHVAVKYLYVRIFRNSKEDVMHQKTWKARGYWILINAVLWIVAWLIAELVPVFNDLLGLTSALFASWFTFGLAGFFWFSMNWRGWEKTTSVGGTQGEGENGVEGEDDVGRGGWGWKKWLLCAVNVLNILVAIALCIIGLYASAKSIAENNKTMGVFSCADNSGRKF